MSEEKDVKIPRKLRKIDKKIEEITAKNEAKPKKSLEKKISKLEKKRLKTEKWLKIKLPFRILIQTATVWVTIAGVSYACSYVPVVKEVKATAMAAMAYTAPKEVSQVLDVVTLNIGANNHDYEWLKTRVMSYIHGEVSLEENEYEASSKMIGYSYDSDNGYTYQIDGKAVSKAEYDQIVAQREKEFEEMNAKAQEAETLLAETLGTDSLQDMSISEILMKIASNSTPELIDAILNTTNLTNESKEILSQDLNRALKIIPKLNNKQMNDLICEIQNEMDNTIVKDAERAQEEANAAMEEERQKMEEVKKQIEQELNY